jgi:hypothetical protein
MRRANMRTAGWTHSAGENSYAVYGVISTREYFKGRFNVLSILDRKDVKTPFLVGAICNRVLKDAAMYPSEAFKPADPIVAGLV